MSVFFNLLVGTVALVAMACSSYNDNPGMSVNATTTETAISTTATEVRGSYDVPGNLELFLPVPDEPTGTILDSEKLDLGFSIIGHRILYVSQTLNGDSIAVSGYVVTNSGRPPEAGWPLIAWAHGTVGTADECAPSHDVQNEVSFWGPLLEAGYAVVATDYEGLGTPGLHPYLVGESEMRGIFDSVRAVQNHNGELRGIQVSDEWVALGYSQGGHAAMHVSQLWRDYAPELNLLGAVAGAPPSQISSLYDLFIDSSFQGYIAMATAAYAAVYPNVNLEEVLGDEALALLPILEEECLSEVLAAYEPLSPEQMSKVPDLLATEPFKSIATENDTNGKPVQVPVLIIHGEDDEQIPAVSSRLLLDQICGMEVSKTVQRVMYPGETHSSVVLASVPDVLDWIASRFSGEIAPTDCPSNLDSSTR